LGKESKRFFSAFLVLKWDELADNKTQQDAKIFIREINSFISGNMKLCQGNWRILLAQL
jgi:hypothetical protein